MSASSYYYDPHLKCIRYNQSLIGDDGTATLHGVIVSVESGDKTLSFLQPGKIMMGEILEIYDPEEEQKVEEEGKRNGGNVLGSAGGLLTHTVMGEVQDSNNTITDKQSILQQKQRQLQTMHSNQHQKLLHKQKKDWEWFHANYLGENRLEELQTIHQKETMELLIRHQREQDEMISFWGECMQLIDKEKQQLQQKFQVEQINSSTQTDLPPPVVVPTAAAPSAPTTALPDRISTDRQKADEIKAVMRNRNLSREERQNALAEIKQRYAGNNIGGGTAAATASNRPTSINTNDQKYIAEQRRLELGSVMKDRSLGRHEKQERMAEIKAKYAAMADELVAQQQQETAAPLDNDQTPRVGSNNRKDISRVEDDDDDASEVESARDDDDEEGSQMSQSNRSEASSQSSASQQSGSTQQSGSQQSGSHQSGSQQSGSHHSGSQQSKSTRSSASSQASAASAESNQSGEEEVKESSVNEDEGSQGGSQQSKSTRSSTSSRASAASSAASASGGSQSGEDEAKESSPNNDADSQVGSQQSKSNHSTASSAASSKSSASSKSAASSRSSATSKSSSSSNSDESGEASGDDNENASNNSGSAKDNTSIAKKANLDNSHRSGSRASRASRASRDQSFRNDDSLRSASLESYRSGSFRSGRFSKGRTTDESHRSGSKQSSSHHSSRNNDSLRSASLESYRSGSYRSGKFTKSTGNNDSLRSASLESYRSQGLDGSYRSYASRGTKGTKDTSASRMSRGTKGTKDTSASRASRGTKSTVRSRATATSRASRGTKGTLGTRGTSASKATRGTTSTAASKTLKKKRNSVPDSVHSSSTSAADMVFDNPGGNISNPVSTDVSLSTKRADPLEDIPTDRTPIKTLIKKLKDDDPSLTVLKLDGRKKIKEADWESLFESLEENCTLTHFSISRCDIEDNMAVSLVLALVENETLEALRLNANKGLTDDTGKGFIKVLKQSNSTLKKLELLRTKVSKKSTNEIDKIMQERSLDKMQEERQRKIKALLSFSAGDELAKDKDDADEDASTGGGSGSKTSSKKSGKNKKKKNEKNASNNRLSRSRNSLLSAGKGAARAGRGGAMRLSTLRASVTAAQMAQLGGDMANVGSDTGKMKEQRKMRGECETCGQKCFNKTMFKSTPLTIPNAVYEGRCLKCSPM